MNLNLIVSVILAFVSFMAIGIIGATPLISNALSGIGDESADMSNMMEFRVNRQLISLKIAEFERGARGKRDR